MPKYEAYWTSPDGKVYGFSGTHIQDVIKNPKRFGLTIDQIQKIYTKHKEKMGLEGKAREEIMKSLMDKGWVRIRSHRRGSWIIQAGHWARRVKNGIFNWVIDAIDTGVSKFDDVMIQTLKPQLNMSYSLIDLLRNNVLEHKTNTNFTIDELERINTILTEVLNSKEGRLP